MRLAVVSPRLAERLEVSPGTELARSLAAGGTLAFHPAARVAKRWTSLSGLPDFAQTTENLWNTVAVSGAGAPLVPELRDIAVLRRSSNEADRRRSQERLGYAARELAGLLEAGAGWRPEEEPSSIGFSWGPSGQANTTTNSTSGEYQGLHLDSWDRLAPRERWRGRNRICINLGAAPRAFQFVAWTADELLDRLEARGGGRFPDLDLARRFLSEFPDEPVFRVWMDPGEAYLAPTENVIHDGSVAPSGYGDLTLTLRGRFRPSEGGGRNEQTTL